MPTLNWIGKKAVENHHQHVPFHLLKEVAELSVGAPDTAQREGAIARRAAIDTPMLIMIRQNGSEDLGWRGVPFYWPVIMAQQNIQLAIFAHETTP